MVSAVFVGSVGATIFFLGVRLKKNGFSESRIRNQEYSFL